MGRVLYCLLVVLLAGRAASAAPITYSFASGSAQVTATAGATPIVSQMIVLDGLFVTFDAMVPEVIDFSFSAPQTAPIAMINEFGGYDTFVIESVSIDPAIGFSNLSWTSTGPTSWNFLIGAVDVAGVYSASHTSGAPPPVSNIPAPFFGSSFLNGSIDTDTMVFELLGVTLAQIDGSFFGEPDLLVKADLTWTGMVIPEPGTALLMSYGLIGLAVRARRISPRNRSR